MRYFDESAYRDSGENEHVADRGAPLSAKLLATTPWVHNGWLFPSAILFGLAVADVLFGGSAFSAPDYSDLHHSQVVLVAAALILICLIWLTRIMSKAWRSQEARDLEYYLHANHRDYAAAQNLDTSLTELLASQPMAIEASAPGIRMVRDATVGQVSRDFDVRTAGSINGWLQHQLAFHGSAGALQVGGFGVEIGRMGLGGESSVDLTIDATSHNDWLAGSFMAVLDFESPQGLRDTVRMVAPTEGHARKFLRSAVLELVRSVDAEMHYGAALVRRAKEVDECVTIETSYASDLLQSTLRMPEAQRPRLSVVGLEIDAHTFLAGQLYLRGHDRPLQLFPIGPVTQLARLVEKAKREAEASSPARAG